MLIKLLTPFLIIGILTKVDLPKEFNSSNAVIDSLIVEVTKDADSLLVWRNMYTYDRVVNDIGHYVIYSFPKDSVRGVLLEHSLVDQTVDYYDCEFALDHFSLNRVLIDEIKKNHVEISDSLYMGVFFYHYGTALCHYYNKHDFRRHETMLAKPILVAWLGGNCTYKKLKLNK